MSTILSRQGINIAKRYYKLLEEVDREGKFKQSIQYLHALNIVSLDVLIEDMLRSYTDYCLVYGVPDNNSKPCSCGGHGNICIEGCNRLNR